MSDNEVICENPTDEEIVEEMKMDHSALEDSASQADDEEHINGEFPTISDGYNSN